MFFVKFQASAIPCCQGIWNEELASVLEGPESILRGSSGPVRTHPP